MLLSVGELNENKNHSTVIKALSRLHRKDIHYVIAGRGDLDNALIELADNLKISDNVHLIGYVENIEDWYKSADVFILPSLREGLSVSLMEAMANGLPCVVSNIRGNIDLIDENGGALFKAGNVNACKDAIYDVIHREYFICGAYNRGKIQKFNYTNVLPLINKIYEDN